MWLVGVVSKRRVWRGSGWNLWAWLVGVVVRRFNNYLPHTLLIPTPFVYVLWHPYFLFIF